MMITRLFINNDVEAESALALDWSEMAMSEIKNVTAQFRRIMQESLSSRKSARNTPRILDTSFQRVLVQLIHQSMTVSLYSGLWHLKLYHPSAKSSQRQNPHSDISRPGFPSRPNARDSVCRRESFRFGPPARFWFLPPVAVLLRV